MGALKAENTGHEFRPVLERGKNNSGGLKSLTVADLAYWSFPSLYSSPLLQLRDAKTNVKDPDRHSKQAQTKIIKLLE